MSLRFSILLPIALLTFSSCEKKEGCTDPSAINYDAKVTVDDGSCVYEAQAALVLHFVPKLGNADFAYATEAAVWDGRRIKVDRAQFYVSQVRLGSNAIADSYLMVTPDSVSHRLGTVPFGQYAGLLFNVGVDSAANHADPATWPMGHALSPNNPYHSHWGWSPGFVFLRVEGQVDTSAAKNGPLNVPLVFHIGFDQFLQEVSIPGAFDFTQSGDVTLHVDWLRLFDGIDLRARQGTHSFNNDPLAKKVQGNISGMFSRAE